MATATAKRTVNDARRGRPPGGNMAPAAYTLLEETAIPSALQFGSPGRTSYYKAAMEKLDEAGEGRVIQFASVKCRGSVTTAARKVGIKVQFAEHDGRLYVKHAGDFVVRTAAAPRPAPVPGSKPKSLQDACYLAVTELPRTTGEVAKRVQAMGFETNNSNVSATLGNLRNANRVYKADHDLCWYPASVPGKPDAGRER